MIFLQGCPNAISSCWGPEGVKELLPSSGTLRWLLWIVEGLEAVFWRGQRIQTRTAYAEPRMILSSPWSIAIDFLIFQITTECSRRHRHACPSNDGSCFEERLLNSPLNKFGRFEREICGYGPVQWKDLVSFPCTGKGRSLGYSAK